MQAVVWVRSSIFLLCVEHRSLQPGFLHPVSVPHTQGCMLEVSTEHR